MTQRSARNAVLVALVSVASVPLVQACSHATTTCTGDLHAYKGKCLTNTAIVYVGCTEGRGLSTASELSASIGGTFKVVAGASIKAAGTRSKTEDTPVALQIVRDCLQLAKGASDTSADRDVASNYESTVNETLKNWQHQEVAATAHITLSRASAAIGQHVTVTGHSFWAGETVDIRVAGRLVKQVKVSSAGHFAAMITVPTGSPPPSFPGDIDVTGETSDMTATAPFHTR